MPDIDEAYEAVTDHVDCYDTPEERQAFITACIAMHMYETDGTLPGSLGVARAPHDDS